MITKLAHINKLLDEILASKEFKQLNHTDQNKVLDAVRYAQDQVLTVAGVFAIDSEYWREKSKNSD